MIGWNDAFTAVEGWGISKSSMIDSRLFEPIIQRVRNRRMTA
jgi:hypothetical protein